MDSSPITVVAPVPPKSWHRLVLSLSGIGIITGMWSWAVHYIYQLPPEKLTAFTSITTNAFYTISAVIIFMISGRMIFEWSNATTAATTVASSIETICERRIDPKDIPGADNVR